MHKINISSNSTIELHAYMRKHLSFFIPDYTPEITVSPHIIIDYKLALNCNLNAQNVKLRPSSYKRNKVATIMTRKLVEHVYYSDS